MVVAGTSQQVIALRQIRGLANNGSPTVRGESGDAITESLAHGLRTNKIMP